MIKINTNFIRLSEVSLAEIYDATGVYVLWSGKSKAYPSYIGEGEILSRFTSHMSKDWAARPIDGLIGFIDANTDKQRKIFSELVEASLLYVSKNIDRYPSHNKSDGKAGSSIYKACLRMDHDVKTIRINISGRDPLRHPANSPLKEAKQIIIKRKKDEWIIDEAHWNFRPIR